MAGHSYQRIAITGDPGSGKSTFAKRVVEITGFRLITTGNMFRELAAQKGISITKLNMLAETQKSIDEEVDDYLRSLNDKEEDLILDSRMAWHFLKGAFKVRLSVEPMIAAQRIFGDNAELREKFSDIETAAEDIEQRKQSEVDRYNKLYGVNISDDSNFDLVIDTSHRTTDETMALFKEAYQGYVSGLAGDDAQTA